jgi:hypothetical protein
MRQSVLLVCAALLLLAGCGRPAIEGTGGAPAAPPGPAAPGGAPDPQAAPAAAAPDRRTEIFIAVLRQYLQADTSFPPGTFRVVFVLDHTQVGADDPFRSENSPPGPKIKGQEAIVSALADIAPVQFVPTRASVIEHEDTCATVRDEGILVTLSEPEGGGDAVEVPINGYVACLGATWLTYVVKHANDAWQVTGTTGTMGIS